MAPSEIGHGGHLDMDAVARIQAARIQAARIGSMCDLLTVLRAARTEARRLGLLDAARSIAVAIHDTQEVLDAR